MLSPCSIGLRFVVQSHPDNFGLICTSCSSGRDFAAGFLQIPPRGGHPCPWLTLPTAKRVRDFHPVVIAHAGRTTKKNPALLQDFLFPKLFKRFGLKPIKCQQPSTPV